MYEKTVHDIKEDFLLLEKKMPALYNSYVETEMILSYKKQKELSLMNKDEIFDYIMHRKTFDHLNIFPQHVTDNLKYLSNKIFKALDNFQIMDEEVIGNYRDILKQYQKLNALTLYEGKLHVQTLREEGDLMNTGKSEFLVTDYELYEDYIFFATNVKGYYGIHKFYEEEVRLIQPSGVNSYLINNTFVINVIDGRVGCPLIAGLYKDTQLEDGQYQVSPIKFYNIKKVTNFKRSI